MSVRTTTDPKKRPTAVVTPSSDQLSNRSWMHRSQFDSESADPLAANIESSASAGGHDFDRIAVQVPAPSKLSVVEACPLSTTPRTCPFGGACHTCPARIQLKLAINESGDVNEQEADRVADWVMGSDRLPERAFFDIRPLPTIAMKPSLAIRRSEAVRPKAEKPFRNYDHSGFTSDASKALDRVNAIQCGSSLIEKYSPPLSSDLTSISIQRYAGREFNLDRFRHASRGDDQDDATHLIHAALRSPGQPLDSESRNFMRASLGYDFSNVRVHADGSASQSAQSVDALAYTTGSHIVFGPGQYAPGTAAGKHLLAHELVHVIQQQNSASAQIQCQKTVKAPAQRTPYIRLDK